MSHYKQDNFHLIGDWEEICFCKSGFLQKVRVTPLQVQSVWACSRNVKIGPTLLFFFFLPVNCLRCGPPPVTSELRLYKWMEVGRDKYFDTKGWEAGQEKRRRTQRKWKLTEETDGFFGPCFCASSPRWDYHMTRRLRLPCSARISLLCVLMLCVMCRRRGGFLA